MAGIGNGETLGPRSSQRRCDDLFSRARLVSHRPDKSAPPIGMTYLPSKDNLAGFRLRGQHPAPLSGNY